MVNYANGGSTCNPLHKRKCQHKKDSKKGTERPVYRHLNAIGWDNVEIILVESFPCNSKAELEARERYWIETLKPTLNKAIPTRTPKNVMRKRRTKFCNIKRSIVQPVA